MREKILAQLIAKYSGVSKTFLGLWADKLAAKVTEESQIQGSIEELDKLPISIPDLAAEYQREGDRRVTEAEKRWKERSSGNPGNPPANDPPKDNPPKEDEVPKWAQGLINEIKTLKAEKIQMSMQAKVKELLGKDVPDKFYAGRALPEKEEDLQTFVEAIKKDYADFKQELVNQGLMSNNPPAGGGSGVGKADNVEADIAAWAEKGKPDKK